MRVTILSTQREPPIKSALTRTTTAHCCVTASQVTHRKSIAVRQPCQIVSASNASSVEPSSCVAAVTAASPTTPEPHTGLITSTAVSAVVKNGPCQRAQQVPQQNGRRLDDVTVVVTRENTGRAVTVTCTSCTPTSQSALSDSLSGLTRRSSGSSPASCDSASTLTSPFQRSMSLASKTDSPKVTTAQTEPNLIQQHVKQKISVLRAYEVATIGRDDPEARFNDGMNFPIGNHQGPVPEALTLP